MFPFLSLQDINLDIQLARQLPRRLAYYHLALPIARDDEQITVAMAHPENQQVIKVLEATLDATVIPVHSFAEMIRQALDRVWQTPLPVTTLNVLYWAQSSDDLDHSAEYVETMLGALGHDFRVERTTASEIPEENTDLVIAIPSSPQKLDALFRTAASLLILRNPLHQPRNILHILRGHIPDYRVLDWLIPIAQQNHAVVTLLIDVDEEKTLVSELGNFLTAQDKRYAHVTECRLRLTEMNVAGRLKIRQETLLNAVRDELTEYSYDLVAIAAEAYGDFAHQVSRVIDTHAPAFLVVKP